MNLVSRATNILTNPKTEWPRAAAEPASCPRAARRLCAAAGADPAILSVLFGLLFASMLGPYAGAGIVYLLVTAALGLVLGLVVLYVMSLIANALAPNFGGVSNPNGALKLLVYSGTAVWVASIFSIIPVLGFLVVIAGYVYAGLPAVPRQHVGDAGAGGPGRRLYGGRDPDLDRAVGGGRAGHRPDHGGPVPGRSRDRGRAAICFADHRGWVEFGRAVAIWVMARSCARG
jgi:hypothetical protein